MQIHLKKQTNIYKYILHVFSLGHTPRKVWQSSHVLAGISMFFFLRIYFLFFLWLVVSHLSMYSLKRDTMKQNLQGNIFKDFSLIRLNVSDFSLLFNCIFYSGGEKYWQKYSALPRKTISCILLCQNPLRQLYPFYFCFALVYCEP